MYYDSKQIMASAEGRWGQIVQALSRYDLSESIDNNGKHMDCPLHGGKRDLRIMKDFLTDGTVVCSCIGVKSKFNAIMALNGIDFKEALNLVGEHLGEGSNTTKVIPRVFQKEQPLQINESAVQKLDKAWSGSLHNSAIKAAPLKQYLKYRSLYGYELNDCVRLAPSLGYWINEGDSENGKPQFKNLGNFPTMLSMITGRDNMPLCLHRTYLAKGGYGKAKLPDGYDPKRLMTGVADHILAVKEASIKLTDVTGDTMGITEGIETAMAVTMGSGMPCWASYSASLLKSFNPPEQVKHLYIWADKDLPKFVNGKVKAPAGEYFAQKLVEALWYKRPDVTCYIMMPPAPEGVKKDWHDVWVEQGIQGFQ